MSELKLPVKQGEEINIGFTINQNGQPMDLSDYTVRFQVKKVPLVNAPAPITPQITTTADTSKVIIFFTISAPCI